MVSALGLMFQLIGFTIVGYLCFDLGKTVGNGKAEIKKVEQLHKLLNNIKGRRAAGLFCCDESVRQAILAIDEAFLEDVKMDILKKEGVKIPLEN